VIVLLFIHGLPACAEAEGSEMGNENSCGCVKVKSVTGNHTVIITSLGVDFTRVVTLRPGHRPLILLLLQTPLPP